MDPLTVIIVVACYLLWKHMADLWRTVLYIMAIAACGAIFVLACLHIYVFAQSHGFITLARTFFAESAAFVVETIASIQWGNLTNIARPKEL